MESDASSLTSILLLFFHIDKILYLFLRRAGHSFADQEEMMLAGRDLGLFVGVLTTGGAKRGIFVGENTVWRLFLELRPTAGGKLRDHSGEGGSCGIKGLHGCFLLEAFFGRSVTFPLKKFFITPLHLLCFLEATK